MARVQYGSIITTINGKVGGSVFQDNKYGKTMKNAPNMKNPNSEAVYEQQRLFAQATQTWRSLTEVQRTAFNTYASTYPQYAKHNSSAELSGYAIFIKWSLVLLQVGYAINPEVVMESLTFPALAPFVRSATEILYVGLGNSVLGDNQRYAVSISGIVSATRNYPPSTFRFLDVFALEDEPKECYAKVLETFGMSPAIGDIVFLRIVSFDILTPQVLAETFYKVTVTAVP
jgi:hypothetical protein